VRSSTVAIAPASAAGGWEPINAANAGFERARWYAARVEHPAQPGALLGQQVAVTEHQRDRGDVEQVASTLSRRVRD